MYDFVAGTDAGLFLLFDPAALRADTAALLDPGIERAVAEGRVLPHSLGGDGDSSLRVYVGRDLPSRMDPHADLCVEGALLRVPSGTLAYAGLEWVAQLEKGRGHRGASWHTVPSGDYRVEAYDMDWDDELESELAGERNGWDGVIECALGPAAGLLCLITIAALVVAAWCTLGWLFGPEGARAPWSAIGQGALWLGAAWAILVVLWRACRARGALTASKRRTIEAQYPAAVVILRRLPDDADLSGLRGARFTPRWY